ncbi:hypothetical protein Tco_0425099 [Tanacetum coccineum]
MAYRLRLPQDLNNVHDTFHVPNLKKCLADPILHVPLEEIQVDVKLNFVEEPVEILEREIKKLKRSRIPIVKVMMKHQHEDAQTLVPAPKQQNTSDASKTNCYSSNIKRLILKKGGRMIIWAMEDGALLEYIDN